MKKMIAMALGLSLLTVGNANESSIQGNVECSPYHREDIKQGVKWYRHAIEQNALYLQIYRGAQIYLQSWYDQHQPKPQTWGVIMDIDETTLDNSWYFEACHDLASDEDDFSFYVVKPERSTVLPGVIDFINQVHTLGGYVSLVSNRDGSYVFKDGSDVLSATVANLKQQGVYFDQVVLANRKQSANPSDKNSRFNAVQTGNYDSKEMVYSNTLPAHKVVVFMGDNIQDFPNLNQKQLQMNPNNISQLKAFGKGYFLLPNPMYGSWE